MTACVVWASEKAREPQPGVIADLLKAHEIRDTKRGCRAWSAARYKAGATRGNDGIEAVTALVYDFDHVTKAAAYDIAERCALHRARGVLYTSYSHGANGDEDQCFRLVLAMSREVTPDEYRRIWEVVNVDLGAYADEHAKDPARIWYIPACPQERAHIARIERLDGSPVNVESLLAKAPPKAPARSIPPVIDWVAEVKALDLSRVLDLRGIAVSGDGRFPCPACGNEDPRGATLKGNTGAWHCHRCHAGGSALDLAAYVLGVTLPPRGDGAGWRALRATFADRGLCSAEEVAHELPPFAPDDAIERMVGAIEDNALEVVASTRQDPATYRALQKGPAKKGEDEGAPLRNDYNLGTILRLDPRWAGRIVYDELLGGTTLDGRPFVDVDDTNIARWVSEVYRLDYTTRAVHEQAGSVADEHRTHPVIAYLDALPKWDGVERLSSVMVDYFGAEGTALNQAIGRCWLISMVARVRKPGCKVDTVTILIGKQGRFKSSTLRAMMPIASWFSDSEIPFGHQADRYQVLRGKWLFEIQEIDKILRSRDSSELKAYVSSQIDNYRDSYGRRNQDRGRQVVMTGTTNEDEFLVDPTGARRFWCVRCTTCAPEAMAAIRDQLWAEASVAWASGESWWLSREMSASAADEAQSHSVTDAWDDVVMQWASNNALTGGTIADVLSGPLDLASKDQNAGASERVRKILKRLGWSQAGRTGPRGRGPRKWMPVSGE